MLFIALLSSIVFENARAAPISPPVEVSPSCTTLSQCRTFESIVYSCVATLAACTWVSVHPNIPGPEASSFLIFLFRLKYMIMALIAPELLLTWAIRQWIVAGRIADKYHEHHGWTRTHGFFLLMGGFALIQDGELVETLSPDRFETFISDGTITFPTISKDHIEDMSKGDPFSKATAIITMTWFTVKCFIRMVYKPQPTELEVMTFCFTLLSIATYVFWWSKPLHVRYPIFLAKEPGSPSLPYIAEEELGSWGVMKALVWISSAMMIVWGEFMDMASGEPMANGDKRVPQYYDGGVYTSYDDWASLWHRVPAIAVAFGALHCFAWNYHFPTTVEQTLWRASSIISTATPILVWLNFYFIERWSETLHSVVFFLLTLGYGGTRLLLLGIAFSSLRSLSPEAYQTIGWSTYAPNIQ
ncbi:hypothetical protein JAAARDRAFT_580275 [Jaapia argillacea MUCL 33604]|uniref:Uncharacterized protein n=1 Tax=Jaapia argillacea MUCL 33604 TaxID=933084 RepID=A0A067P9T9_9AGAM|nr:hypothetical protein JAAARDRAFT_580275 [Jaapia argillacea MUCL 33604]